MHLVYSLLLLSIGSLSLAAGSKNTNLIAVGQGISSPTSTSMINFSSGYTSESPLGTIYQNGFRVTAQYDKDDDANKTEAFGAEVGYGQGEWGIAAGQRKRDCTNCDSTTAGAVGVSIGSVGVGVRFQEDIYALGVLINPNGNHRFGLMAESNDSGGSGSNITAYGLGYSYVEAQYTLTLDVSSRTFENDTIDDDRMQVTPGVMFRADIFQLSINDKITLNSDDNNPAHDDEDHSLWFGVGLGGDRYHLAVYSDYVNEIAVAGTLFF